MGSENLPDWLFCIGSDINPDNNTSELDFSSKYINTQKFNNYVKTYDELKFFR